MKDDFLIQENQTYFILDRYYCPRKSLKDIYL